MTPSEFQDLLRRAEDGDVEAQYDLADMYHRGRYVPRNYSEAEKWYLRCRGRDGAQRGLGLLYLKGLGDIAEGLRLLTLAGKRGDAEACYELAKALSQPSGQDNQQIAAYTWFCLAEAYGLGDRSDKVCKKEIESLESELSKEQIQGAQLRARDLFEELQVVLAEAEKPRRVATIAKRELDVSLLRVTTETRSFPTHKEKNLVRSLKCELQDASILFDHDRAQLAVNRFGSREIADASKMFGAGYSEATDDEINILRQGGYALPDWRELTLADLIVLFPNWKPLGPGPITLITGYRVEDRKQSLQDLTLSYNKANILLDRDRDQLVVAEPLFNSTRIEPAPGPSSCGYFDATDDEINILKQGGYALPDWRGLTQVTIVDLFRRYPDWNSK